MPETDVEVPLESPVEPSEAPPATEVPDVPDVAAVPPESAPKRKVGRPKGAKDTKPRAKPKASAKRGSATAEPPPAPRAPERTPDSDCDDGYTLRELGMMHLLNTLQAHRNNQRDQKRQLYASWFGR